MKKTFSHISQTGEVQMVNVSSKKETKREAIAKSKVLMKKQTLKKIIDKQNPKGDIISTAKIAGIMAAKRTSELIPLCHQINLTKVEINIDFDIENSCINIESICTSLSQTGVEMEALTGASVTALTLYDMCKAVDKTMLISDIHLFKKTGGKSDRYIKE
tara:strand:- start:20 stop:499 length:480 start_codon:yes stop_codon:yes gene_type:complete